MSYSRRRLGRRPVLAMGVLALTGAAAGCGYALAGRGSSLPATIKTVGIPLLENRTPYSRLEIVMTDRLRTEFIGRNKYRVVHETTGVEAVLKGEIIGFSLQTAALNEQQLSSRQLVTIVLKVSFINASDNEVLWSNDALTFRDEYQFAAGGISATALVDQERSTMERIATDASRTIVTAIFEAF